MTTPSSRWTATLVACLLALPLVACSGGDPDPAPTEPPSSSPGSAPPSSPSSASGPLRLSVYGVPEAVEAYKDVASAFTAESGVQVEVVEREGAAGAGAAAERALSRPGGGPDVFLVDDAALPAIFDTGRLQPLDVALEERGLQFGDGFQRVALTAYSADDGLQCMPVDMSPRVLFVNRDLVRPRDLEIRGVPLPERGQWQFEDFDAAARLIAREQQGVSGFHAVHLPADVELFTAFLRSAGGDVVDDVDEPTELTLDNDEAREVLQAYTELARMRAVSLTDDEAADVGPVERFGRGDLAMMFGTRADVPALRETDVRFDVMPLPTFGAPRTVADLSGLCVDSESAQVSDAIDLVAFIAANEGSSRLARSGAVVPANLDVAFSPAFAQRGLPPPSVRVFRDSLKRSGLMPFAAAWQDVGGRVERLLTGLVQSGRDIEGTLETRLPQLDERSKAAFAPPEETAEDD